MLAAKKNSVRVIHSVFRPEFSGMSSRILSMTVALTALSAMTTQTVAGGYAQSCYEKVHHPPQYKTVHETVMVDPGRKQVEVIPAIYGTEKRRVLIRPEQVGYNVVPARYGWSTEKVLIQPESTIARHIPAVTKTVHRKVMVSEGGYTWEWQIIKGRKVLCKVKRPAVWKTVAEHVVVRPAQTYHERVPARWGYEKRQVMIEPARKERYVIPAEYGYTNEQVLIRPAEKRVHHTPPRYETVARTVMVRPGSSGWRQVQISGHCKG
jgi:regulator of extracellular matrix RemA (YlzA/DUF370 family)